MQTETLYELRFRDDAGLETGGRIGYGPGGDANVLRFFGYTKRLHYPGLLWFGLDSTHPILELLRTHYQIEVWRSVDTGATWYRDFTGLYRADADYDDRGKVNFQARAAGPLQLLNTVIAWTAGTVNRTLFTAQPAETVLKTLVTTNATAAATQAAGRDVTFASAPFTITVEADGGGGNAVTKACSRKQLLEILRELARIAGGDFDVVRDASNPLAWEFRWFSGQRGVDRSASVIFSRENGNLTDFQYSQQAAGATVAIVGGPGQGAEREITVVLSADYSASNHRELFVNATDQDTVAGRTAKGNEVLDAQRTVERSSFSTRQVDGARYGQDYCVDGVMGDLVTVVRAHDSVSATHKITGVTVSVNARGEQITLETETP